MLICVLGQRKEGLVSLLPGEQNLKKDNYCSFKLVIFNACEIVNLEPEA